MKAILPQFATPSASKVAQSLQVAASTAARLQNAQLGTTREESMFLIPFGSSDQDLEVCRFIAAATIRAQRRNPYCQIESMLANARAQVRGKREKEKKWSTALLIAACSFPRRCRPTVRAAPRSPAEPPLIARFLRLSSWSRR
jgi:hypothetical protein